MLGKLMNTYHVYTARMSPAFNGSSVLERFERSTVIEICNGIMSNFYPGLSQICFWKIFASTQFTLFTQPHLLLTSAVIIQFYKRI